MMISSKIGSKDNWKTDRLENKEEYVENLILNIEILTSSDSQLKMFENLVSCDQEMKWNLGGIHTINIRWYEIQIRKQLMKLDTTALAFLNNAVSLIAHNNISSNMSKIIK